MAVKLLPEMESYLTHLESQGRRSVVTTAHYLGAWRLWLEANELEYREVTGIQAEAFQREMAVKTDESGEPHYSSKSVAMAVWVVGSWYEWLREEGLVLRDPFRGVAKMKLPRRVPREVPEAEALAEKLNVLSRFWEADHTRDRRTRYRLHVMAEVLYATGMRLAELGALEPTDFDLAAKTVRIKDGKDGVARVAFLTDYAAQVVGIYLSQMREAVHYRAGQSTVFGTASGQCLAGILNQQLKTHVGMTSHGFRHAVGTHLLRSGCDLRMIQLILGHEDLKSTAIYTQVVKEQLRDQLDRHHPRSGGLE